MRKAKVAAIVCGMIASCLFGGFAVVEAATITLDDSSADLVVYVQPTTGDYELTESAIAVTVTSIETTAEPRTTTVNYAGTSAAKVNTKREAPAAADNAVEAGEKVEAATTTAVSALHESPITTETVVRAPKESAARTTTAVTTTTTAVTTTTTVAATTAVQVETVPITEEVNIPQMPAEQAEAAFADAFESGIAVSVQPAAEQIAAEMPVTPPAPVTVADVIDTSAMVDFEIPDPSMLVAPEVQPYEAPTDAPAVQPDSNSVSVSQSDYVLLCNAVAHEAGSNSISAEDKAKVVEVIMNRVNSSKYPDSIYGVLTQKYQFTGSSTYVDLGSFSGKVTDLVKEAVDMYLSDPTRFDHGYLNFYGDGSRNHFS